MQRHAPFGRFDNGKLASEFFTVQLHKPLCDRISERRRAYMSFLCWSL